MEKIKVEAKYILKEQVILDELKQIEDPEISIDIVQEEQPKSPTVSKSSLAAHIFQQAIETGQTLLQADSVLRIWGDLFIGTVGTKSYKLIKDKLLKLIKANNRKKGNMIGVEVSIHQDILGIDHICNFICDSIPEGELETALSKIDPYLKNLKETIGEEHLKQVKNMAFTYTVEEGWKLAGAEKIN